MRRLGFLRSTSHVERSDLDAVAAALLGVIERLVGLRQQLGHVERRLLACTSPMLTVAQTGWPSTSCAHLGKGLADALGHRHALSRGWCR